ncbi:MAG: terpene cyclase/mutase family protein [Planctomycetaceae bacterium]|nr:terpene cyclase/mutase family protein [Planctomycetaceae bacterium]
MDRGLEFLSRHQNLDGSIDAPPLGQPAVTSFGVIAFLGRGHVPGEGRYGDLLSRAIDYVLTKQQPDGLFCDLPKGRQWNIYGAYHHPISGLMLGEVYGMTQSPRQERIRQAIDRALAYSRKRQTAFTEPEEERGGWRYLLLDECNAALSSTAWELMFDRSARNAEFDVPQEYVDEAIAFVKRCYVPQMGTFSYGLSSYRRKQFSRSMAGAGILSLSLAGEHRSEMAMQTASFVLSHPFDDFNRGNLTREDRYFYGAYYCSQAMFQLGGEHWQKFYPGLLKTFFENQLENGAWPREANKDEHLGFCYSTSFALLALTPPYQLLPIYQR